ncbi:MAG: Nramp family divalent metal transporter [Flavobacteriales bacterium]|nr:Nramp family divalent metal transporter [Flavobacteriales bacterium]
MNIRRILLTLGPGILFASTAIGTSHLVQSTRAGADYGFALLWAILAANVAKYPFFEFGTRYANATGTSLIAGYRTFGKWASWTYLVLTALTCAFVMGGVGIVTASFLDHLFGASKWLGSNATPHVAVLTFTACVALLLIGRYGALDKVIKAISLVLLVGTVSATVGALIHTPLSAVPAAPQDFNPWHGAEFTFLIALLGWMPSAVDLSPWVSIWTLERYQQTGFKPKLRAALKEFNLGYSFCVLLALCFLLLGALLLRTHDMALPSGTAAFAAGVIGLYTEVLGPWSAPFVGSAAFAAMLGTCIACLDGFSRSFSHGIAALRDAPVNLTHERTSLVLISLGALLLIIAFPSDIRTLLDLGNILSFCIAPPSALAMLILVTRSQFPKAARPKRWLRWTAYFGLAFLMALTVLFLRSLVV